jgi:hypothetical protein
MYVCAVGKTPLQNATFKGNVECMKILIEKGAEVNTKDNDDSTPMHKASLLQSSGTYLYVLFAFSLFSFLFFISFFLIFLRFLFSQTHSLFWCRREEISLRGPFTTTLPCTMQLLGEV